MVSTHQNLTQQLVAKMVEMGCPDIANKLKLAAESGSENSRKRTADVSVLLITDGLEGGEDAESKLWRSLKQLNGIVGSLSKTENNWWVDGLISTLVAISGTDENRLRIFFTKLLEAICPDYQGWDFGKGIYPAKGRSSQAM